MNKSIVVATTQYNHVPGDKEYNLRIIEKMCINAVKKGAEIIIFPEMCIPGYWHIRKLKKSEIEELSESAVWGTSVLKLKALSVKYKLIIGAGIIEKSDDGKFYNTYIITQPDRKTEFHRKLHCFISPHMSSGDSYTVIETSLGVKIGVLICWDNNLIENTRSTALLGADILFAPHQTGGCSSKSNRVLGKIDLNLWESRDLNPEKLREEFQSIKGRKWIERWLPSRAHDNGMFIMFSNGVGIDDDEVRTGNAMLIDCYGEIINESLSIEDDIVIGVFDTDLLKDCIGRNWIQGRRPDLYSEISKPINNKDVKELKFME